MISPCSCECHDYNSASNNHINITYPNSNTQNNIDIQICELESEIEERIQNTPDYSELEAKFRKLENDLQILSEEKLQVEYELRQACKENDKLVSDLQLENDHLSNEINEKNIMIEELYLNNNNLYSILDNKEKDSQYLKEKLITQNDVLQKINDAHKNLKDNLNNLNILKNQDFSDIQNLEDQINCFARENENNDIELNKINELNNQCINEIKNETCMNHKLEQILKDKDIEIKESTNELELTNETLKRLGNELNNLNEEINENEENINICDEKLIKVSQIKNEILDKNQQINDLINENDKEIDRLNNENINYNNSLDNLNNDIILLENKIEEYKQHIINLTDVNIILTKELGGIIMTDEKMRNNAIDRLKYLKDLKEDNKNIINQSLNIISTYMQKNGNKGCYIKVENKIGNNNKVKKEEIKKGKYFSFKGNDGSEEEENNENQYSEEED